MLSSFINRRKVKKISLFDAALRRTPSSPPLDAQSDLENPRPKQWTSRARVPTVTTLRASALHRQSSPKVHLDFTPSGLNDWFSQEILAPFDDDNHLPVQPVPDSSTSSTYSDVVVIGPELPPLKRKPSPALPPPPVDDGPSPIEPGHDTATPPMSRKPAPAPIKIPSHPSKVQIQRSASAGRSGLKGSGALFPTTVHEPSSALQPGTAHPSSAISVNDDSAISGTTIARALFADSFILSHDNHGRIRYKSGGNFARQDSATLPGSSDNGLLISPYWRDRRMSVYSPDSGVESRIPPVPPIPANLSSAVSHVRHLSTEMPRRAPSRSHSLRIGRLSHRTSKKSGPRSSPASAAAGPSHNSPPTSTQIPASRGSRSSLPQPPPNQPTLSHDNSFDHSLNDPPSPPPDSSLSLNVTSSESPPISIRRSQLPPSLDLPPSSEGMDRDGSKLHPTPNGKQDEPQRTGASVNTTQTEKTVGSATSGEDITKVLTTYRFGSPMKSSFPAHLHESPDRSTPSLSPWSGGSKSHKTDTSNSPSFPETPTSAIRRSRNGLSALDMRRVFTDSNIPGQRQSGSSRPGLLPIGNNRPRSLHVPSSPYSRKSNESRRSTDGGSSVVSNPHLSGMSSPDILDFMFVQPAPSLPSRTHPMIPVRKSLESLDGVPDRSPTTTEAFLQTFPETPRAFSPLFSANIGTPGVPPLPSTMGTPGTPSNAAQTRGKLRQGIPIPLITRAASLHTRKIPPTSNLTRMSPIPSAPGTPRSPEVHQSNDLRKSSMFEVQQSLAAASLLETSLSTLGKVSLPPSPSPRRNSDPIGRASRDLATLAGRVEEVSHFNPEVKGLTTDPLGDPSSQQVTLALLEKSPSPSVRAEEGERRPFVANSQPMDGDNSNIGSASKLSSAGSAQSDNQVRRSGPKQRPRPLDLPVVKSDHKSTTDSGAVVKPSDGSSEVRQGQGSAGSQTDITPDTSVVPGVSTDATQPVVTSTETSVTSVTSVHPSGTPEKLPARVDVLPSPGLSYFDPLSASSLQLAEGGRTTSSPIPSSQRSPARSPSNLNPTPTSSTSRPQNPSPALPSSTLVSPAQYDQSNSLGIPSFASFLRQSYGDLAAVNPPPPYQTAILTQAVSVDGGNESSTESPSPLPSYILTPPKRKSGGPRSAQSPQPSKDQVQYSATNAATVSEAVARERSDSVPDTRIPRSRPLGPRNPSGSQGPGKVSSLESYRSRAGSVSSTHSHLLRSGVGLGTPPTSRKLSAASIRGRLAPRFSTVPVKWRGYTLDVARWTFTSQQLQDIASRAIKASAESYYVRLLKLETLDTELPEELHRLELSTTELKTRIRATASARRELLDALTAHTSGAGTFGPHEFEGVLEELGAITQLGDELNDELYTVADQIAQLKRLRDVHSGSALAMALRKLNTSFLRQATENQFLRERVASLEAERDIAWAQAENVAHEFDDLSVKLERGTFSTSSSANNSRRASRINAVRKSSIRVSKCGLRQSVICKAIPRAPNRLSSVSFSMQPSEDVPPVPPIPEIPDLGSTATQPPRHRPPFIQTANLPDYVTSAGLYSEMTPNTETRAMVQAQRELCEMLGISPGDFNALKSRPRSMSEVSRPSGLLAAGLLRHNTDVKPLTPKRHSQHYGDYLLSPYDRGLTLANLTLLR